MGGLPRLISRLAGIGAQVREIMRGWGEIFGISNRAALDGISGLIELKVIKQMGKGRGVH